MQARWQASGAPWTAPGASPPMRFTRQWASRALQRGKTHQRASPIQSWAHHKPSAKSWAEIERIQGIKRMANDDVMTAVQPTTEPPPRSPAAARMRAHRKRKRQGLRCVTVQLRETEIDVLIKMGLLTADTRNDPQSVRKAVHTHFDRTLRSIP